MDRDDSLKALGDNARFLEEDVEELARATQRQIDRLPQHESETRAKIVNVMQDVRAEIARKETELFSLSQGAFTKCRTELQANLAESKELVKEIGSLSVSIEAGNVNDEAGMKQSFECLESKYFELQDRNVCPELTVRPEDIETLENLKFGELAYHSEFVPEEQLDRSDDESPGYDEVVPVNEFSCQTKVDIKDPFLTSMIWVNGKVIITDKANRKVKFFRESSGDYVQDMFFTNAEPYGVCAVQTTAQRNGIEQYAVTLPKVKKIFFINLLATGIQPPYVNYDINTSVGYGGISDIGGRLIVTAVNIDFPRVDIIDYLGNTLSSMALDAFKAPLFSFPRYVVTDGNVCVISDWRKNTVMFIRHIDCAILGSYSGTDEEPLVDPFGITVDGKGYIYVMDGKTGKIHVVNRNFGLVRLIEESKMLLSPRLLAYDTRSDTLAVSYTGGQVKYFPVTSAVPNYNQTSGHTVVPSAPFNPPELQLLGVQQSDPHLRSPSPGF